MILTKNDFLKMFRPAQSVGWDKVISHDPCVYFGREIKKSNRTREHIVPKSAGGKGDWGNIVSACLHCNVARSSIPLLLWLVNPPLEIKKFWNRNGSPFGEIRLVEEEKI